jgi:hypothetical protein
MRGPPDPEMQRAAQQGDPNCNVPISNSDHTETATNHQAFRLISRFGFALETALVVAALAWGIGR